MVQLFIDLSDVLLVIGSRLLRLLPLQCEHFQVFTVRAELFGDLGELEAQFCVLFPSIVQLALQVFYGIPIFL